MENENTNEKKKQIRLAIIGVVTLIMLTLGATFAYFLIDTNNSTSKSNIKGDIDVIDSIALQKVTENLHVNLSAADMAEANKNTEYYGDDTANYVKTLEEGMHNLGKLTATGGNGKTRYMCTANAVITMQVASENDMGKFFNTGDAYLYLNAGSLQQRIDLSELKESGTRTIPFEIGITSESERQIDGYVEIINTASDQTYLANKTLNIDVTFQDLECNVGVSEVETNLRKYDKENKLTTNLVNGLYRYQGNSIISNYNFDGIDEATYDIEDTVKNNYICLGQDCLNEESQDMYRIIGVTEDGLMKVIKSTPIEQHLQWWTDDQTDIKWSESLIYQYLNSEYYNSLPIELKNRIVDITWVNSFVDINDMSIENKQKMSEYEEIMYSDAEDRTIKEAYKNYGEIFSNFLVNEEKKGVVNKTVDKVSIMNLTDYCSSFESNGYLNCMDSQMFFVDYYESGDYIGLTWLTPDYNFAIFRTTSKLDDGLNTTWGFVTSEFINQEWGYDTEFFINPVFFLTSDIELSGEGTIDTPFTIGIE